MFIEHNFLSRNKLINRILLLTFQTYVCSKKLHCQIRQFLQKREKIACVKREYIYLSEFDACEWIRKKLISPTNATGYTI